MYSEEYPQNLCFSISCFDFCKGIILLLCSKTSFQPGSSFPAKFTSDYFTELLIFSRPAFANKRSGNAIFSAELTVFIVCIHRIRCNGPYTGLCQLLLQPDTVLQTYPFIKSLKRKMFDEGDAIYLNCIYFRTKLYYFGFFAPDDRV